MPSRVTTTRADTTQWLLIWTRVTGSRWPSPKMTRSRMRCTTGSTLGHWVTSSPRHPPRWWSLGRITVSHRISRRLVACPLAVTQRQTRIFHHRPRRRKSQSTPGEQGQGHEYLCVHSWTVNKPLKHWQITFELINLQWLDKSNWIGRVIDMVKHCFLRPPPATHRGAGW